jgi:hypothetical protein
MFQQPTISLGSKLALVIEQCYFWDSIAFTSFPWKLIKDTKRFYWHFEGENTENTPISIREILRTARDFWQTAILLLLHTANKQTEYSTEKEPNQNNDKNTYVW